MSEVSSQVDEVVEVGRVTVIAHLLIRDKQSGQVLVNKRDTSIAERNLKADDEHTPR